MEEHGRGVRALGAPPPGLRTRLGTVVVVGASDQTDSQTDVCLFIHLHAHLVTI